MTVLDDLEPDRYVIARNIVKANSRKSKTAPTTANLATALSSVQMITSMKNVGSLTAVVNDPQWTFMDSGFFDTDENGEIDPIDVNYPDGSRFWWRLTQVSASDSARQITLTFLVRESVYLQHLHGPKSANRAKMSRAEFLQSCCKDVKEGPIEFYCQQLDTKQKIANPDTSGAASGSKSPGVGADVKNLTVKGRPMTVAQASVATELLSRCALKNAPESVCVAIIYAGIWESGLDKNEHNKTYGGVLASNYKLLAWDDIDGQADSFLVGGRGYIEGGALALFRNAITDPVEIAVTTEAPSNWPKNAYATETGYPGDKAAIAEATAIVAAAAGGGISAATTTTTTTQIETYNYQINPGELYWVGMQRLEQEVNWELFWDGNRLYYDSEQTLIRQKASAVIHRDDVAVIDWDFTWDARQLCTQMTLVLLDEPMEFRAGEVIQLVGFGTVSAGSSASPKRPGYWLIQDSTRTWGELSTTYTLVQPDLPKLEPAPQIKTSTTTTTAGGEVADPSSASYKKLNAPGIVTWSGRGAYKQAPIRMCVWIANELNWAIDNGWTPAYPITSGYRPGVDPNTASGTSEHQGTSFPGGAIDFGGAVNLVGYNTKKALVDLATSQGYPGPRLQMPVFKYNAGAVDGADDGHLSGNGH